MDAPGEKAALLAEIEASGGHVWTVARPHGVSKSLLYNWRSAWKAAAQPARGSTPGSAGLIQFSVVADTLPDAPAMRMTAGPVGWTSGFRV